MALKRLLRSQPKYSTNILAVFQHVFITACCNRKYFHGISFLLFIRECDGGGRGKQNCISFHMPARRYGLRYGRHWYLKQFSNLHVKVSNSTMRQSNSGLWTLCINKKSTQCFDRNEVYIPFFGLKGGLTLLEIRLSVFDHHICVTRTLKFLLSRITGRRSSSKCG